MRALFTGLLFLQISTVFGQSIDSVKTDSIKTGYFTLTPALPKKQIHSSGNVVVCIDDTTYFQTNYGISIFNSLRGQVPNFTIDPYFKVRSIGWRSSTPLLVIDGLPYSQEIINSYNFNAIEFTSINLLISGNASTLFGSNGANGAVILQTKSGEGKSKPTIEFNSYTTNSWNMIEEFNVTDIRDSIINRVDSLGIITPDTVQFYEGENSKKRLTQWFLSNTLAYSQDFGKVDLR
ncbi:MAG: TonB-dependent receptor, partial [Saprospiraceae bacterium]